MWSDVPSAINLPMVRFSGRVQKSFGVHGWKGFWSRGKFSNPGVCAPGCAPDCPMRMCRYPGGRARTRTRGRFGARTRARDSKLAHTVHTKYYIIKGHWQNSIIFLTRVLCSDIYEGFLRLFSAVLYNYYACSGMNTSS